MSDPVYRADLPERPGRIAALPLDHRGYPVPRFVALVDGQPDHRLVNPPYLAAAVRRGLCWVCGEPLGKFKNFLVGPMCTINRVSSEPPQHRECAEYAARACPFLSKPQMHRREAGLPGHVVDPAGGFIKRNPGAVCIWTCHDYEAEVTARGDGQPSLLFYMGQCTDMQWIKEGRAASRAEVMDAISSGLPTLQKVADEEGMKAVYELGRMTGELVKLLDAYLPGSATLEPQK